MHRSDAEAGAFPLFEKKNHRDNNMTRVEPTITSSHLAIVKISHFLLGGGNILLP